MVVVNVPLEIEGHDKNGKDTIAKYIEQLGNYKYTINVRGILTQLVYNDKFSRDNVYRLCYKPLIILLRTNPEDVEIRCRMTKEPKINIVKDTEVYEEYAKYLEENNLAIVWRYDTSESTPYNIGKDIVEKLSKINGLDFTLECPVDIPCLNKYKEEDLKDEEVYYGPLETNS